MHVPQFLRESIYRSHHRVKDRGKELKLLTFAHFSILRSFPLSIDRAVIADRDRAARPFRLNKEVRLRYEVSKHTREHFVVIGQIEQILLDRLLNELFETGHPQGLLWKLSIGGRM